MLGHFTLEYWIDDSWYVGKLREVPGVFSQGETLEKLEENIKDAISIILSENDPPLQNNFQTKELELEL